MKILHIPTQKIKTFIPALAAAWLFTQAAGAASTNYTWNVSSGNWSSAGSWTPNNGEPGPASIDSATFGNANESASSSTVNNTVDSNFAIANLNYTNVEPTGSYNYAVTLIPANKTLTVTNSFLVGGANIGSANTSATYAYLLGGGTLKVTAPSFYVQDASSVSGTTTLPCAYLNLSGLTNFIYNNPSGMINISTNGGSMSGFTRMSGSMTLACGSNNITAAAINLGTASSAQGGAGIINTGFGSSPASVQNNAGPIASGSPAVFTLGPGTNIINAKTINVGNMKYGFVITNTGGGLRIRGVTGADSDANVNITVGDRSVSGGSGASVGWLLLDGCSVNIKANSMILGERVAGTSNGSNGGDGGAGLLEFDDGVISANSLQMAYNLGNSVSGTAPSQAQGEILVGPNGQFKIGAGQLFALATALGTGPATGTLVVSNGLINCLGPIVMGPCTNSVPSSGLGTATGNIQLVGAGNLSMGPNSYIGSISNPISSLILDTNSELSISIPSPYYTNICVQNLTWPAVDTNLTIAVAAIPAGITNNELFSFLNFSGTMVNTFNAPILSLPVGVTGNLSLAGGANTMYLTITSGAGLGYGGVNQLTNAYFISGVTNWTTIGNGASLLATNATYPNTGGCSPDTRNVVAYPNAGTNVAKLTGSFVAGGSTNILTQTVPVLANSQIVPGSAQLTPGAQITLGCSTYVAHEDIMSGADSFYYEVDFLDTNNNLIAAYESGVLTNLSCGSPYVDNWDLMALTNQMQIVGGANSGVVATTIPNDLIFVPPQAGSAKFKAVFVQRNATDSGSVYISGANIGFLQSPAAPTISTVTPNLVTLCTNTYLSCTATSSITSISSFQVTATTTTLGVTTNTTTVYTNGSAGLSFTGLGTSNATVNLTLATNTIYQSVVVSATDADGLSVTAGTVSFDTLVPSLVIEGSDFNYSSGLFIDTPANGGLALYEGQIGVAGIDENKVTRAGTQSYYRTNDATIIQAANSSSGTEQKFVTAKANGDTNFEVAIAVDSVGDWQNYTRTFASSGGSAQPGTYNVWCYLATSGSGAQVGFYQVTNSPTTTGQLTNFIGNFGSPTFSDNSYNNFVYAPLVDGFGNRVALTITNGQQTFRGQIINSDTPNVGFYMLTPVIPTFNPVFLNVSPTNTYSNTNKFTFTVGPAQGAGIATNGIGLTVNGVPITTGLSFTALAGGAWTVNYNIQTNSVYTVIINVTNMNGIAVAYTNTFDTFNINNFRWMAVDYDFSTNNGTGAGGSVGNGWTGGLFITNPVPTADTNSPFDQTWQLVTNSYCDYPSGWYPALDPYGFGAVAQQSIDINWLTNATQDTGGLISNSVYRAASIAPVYAQNGGDGVGTQVAADNYLLPEFAAAQTNTFTGRDGSIGGPDTNICEFNIGYFYTNDWLNYTRIIPTGTYFVWGRLASGGGSFSGCTLSQVTSGVGTSNQTTQVLGSFSDPSPAGWQSYHWIVLSDTNNNPVYLHLGGQETLRLTAPANAGPGGGSLNALYFMLTPAVEPSVFSVSAVLNGNSLQISIPTQNNGHNYVVYTASSLSSSSWVQVGGSITGDGNVHVVSVPASAGQSFYRVLAQ